MAGQSQVKHGETSPDGTRVSRVSASSQAALLKLPRPRARGGHSLTHALRSRRTTRDISDRALDLGRLSDLLWAACGVNRDRGPFGMPGRTAASASNSQEIEVYVATAYGTYRYEPREHRLRMVVPQDLRALAISHGQSREDQGAHAPVRLIYVADVDRLAHTSGFDEPGLHDPKVQEAYYHVDTGLIAANVYLFASSRGLGAWFHNCDRIALAKKLGLHKAQRVLFAQTVGYPMKKTRTRMSR